MEFKLKNSEQKPQQLVSSFDIHTAINLQALYR